MFRRVLALALVVLGGPAASREIVPGPLAAEVVEIVDGDTIAVRVHVWLGQLVETRVRLLGVDAPELRGRCAEERGRAERAREWLRERIGRGEVVLRDIRFDKYGGRVLAQVETASGEDLARELLAEGLARPYRGGRRAGWCDAEEASGG